MTTAHQSDSVRTTPLSDPDVQPFALTETGRATTGRGLVLAVAALVWVLDQVTKALVVRALPFGMSWSPFPDAAHLFQFTHTTNTGMAFGLFPAGGWLFVVVGVVVISLGLVFYRHLPTHRWPVRVALGLQLGGALGNLTDRLVRGSVVDFVDVGAFWIFNLADSALTLGVAIMAFYLLREERS